MKLRRLTAIACGNKIFLQVCKDEPTIVLILPEKDFQFFTTAPVPIRMSSQASMVIGPRIAANYG